MYAHTHRSHKFVTLVAVYSSAVSDVTSAYIVGGVTWIAFMKISRDVYGKAYELCAFKMYIPPPLLLFMLRDPMKLILWALI